SHCVVVLSAVVPIRHSSRPCFLVTDRSSSVRPPLPLHDALPISEALAPTRIAGDRAHRPRDRADADGPRAEQARPIGVSAIPRPDRKSTRLNSSHVSISYAVFCLKKKIKNECRWGKQRGDHLSDR